MTIPTAFLNYIEAKNRMSSSFLSSKLWMRYRCEYEFILCRLCHGDDQNNAISIGDLISCSELGSQPTIAKRINELETLKLIQSKNVDDGRMRIVTLTERGREYLEKCSQILIDAINTCAKPKII